MALQTALRKFYLVDMAVLLICIAVFLFLFSYFLPKQDGPTTHGSAHFISKSEHLRKRNKGFLIDTKSLDVRTSCQHLILVGGSGTGKTQRLLLKTVFSQCDKKNSSLIVLDPKKEIQSITQGYCEAKGMKVYSLDLITPEYSHSWNCFENISSDDIDDLVSRMYEITNQNSSQQESIWKYGTISLISVIIYTLFHYQQGSFLNLSNVLHTLNMLQVYPQKVMNWIQQHSPNEQVYLKARTFLAQEVKIRDGQLSGAIAVLSAFVPQVVQKVSNVTTLPSLETLRSERSIIYLCLPIGKEDVYRPFISLFLSSFMNEVVNTPSRSSDLHLAFILEEFSTLNIPAYASILATIRQRRAMTYHCIQNIEQLFDRYSQFQAETILSNCSTWIIMPGLKSIKSQNFVKQSLLGSATVSRKNGSTESEHHTARYLLTNDELRRMDSEQAILITGSEEPMFIYPKPLYKSWWLKRKFGLKNKDGELVSKHASFPFVNAHQEPSFLSFDSDSQSQSTHEHEQETVLSFQERLEALLKKSNNE